jgi:iron complex outermembrane receptor protein
MMNRLKSSRAAALVLLHAAVLAQTPLEAPPSSVLEVITVTATKEKSTLQETPASIGVIHEDALRFASPSHPQQLLSQIPGVAVGVTQGEGHTMAIRQPFSTSPVYLYLEDGIPTRATGFFNHNALY